MLSSSAKHQQLRDDDLQHQGEGEYRGVTDRDGVSGNAVGGEGEGGGLGLHAGAEAEESAEIALAAESQQQPEHEVKQQDDGDGGGDQHHALKVEHGGKATACAAADDGEEQRDTKVTQGEVVGKGDVPDEWSGAAKVTKEKGDDQWPACGAELEGI